MFDTQKRESTKNAIAYVAPKNKMMAHSMRLNNSISCVVVISIFRFTKYWKGVFNFMDIKTTPTFKQFLQVKILNADKNKSFYKQYNFKILISFHK